MVYELDEQTSFMLEGIRFMTKYDPNREIPIVTPEIQLRLTRRHGELWTESTDKELTYNERFDATAQKLTDAEWFEVMFIASISHSFENTKKTVGYVSTIIAKLATTTPRVKGWSEAKMQQHIATAADTVIRLMTA